MIINNLSNTEQIKLNEYVSRILARGIEGLTVSEQTERQNLLNKKYGEG